MANSDNSIKFIKYFIPCLVLCLGGGWLTGWVTQEGVKEWYPSLIKPYGTPPNGVFPIVWSVIYLFMAIALTLLCLSSTLHKQKAFLFFVLQLILNFSWSFLFFYLRRPDLALIDIIFLWIAIALTISYFKSHTLWGSYLLFPYLIWVTYALYLNYFIWSLNFINQ